MLARFAMIALPAGLLLGCNGAPQQGEAAAMPGAAAQDVWWSSLQALCGRAFEGRLAEAPPGDTVFAGRALVMHVRQCNDHEIRIPFHVGDDHSRTWIIARTTDGVRLKHDHRHRDGSEDEITQYGGDTATPGTARRQEFPADAHTASLIPAAATNVWTIEVIPGEAFVYALRREGTDRRFRLAFDLTRPIPPPPAPWGHN
jgi:cell wall-associated NlpC family hydrolase